MAIQIDSLPADGRGAPPGARLPRTRDLTDLVEDGLALVARNLGTVMAIERSRLDLNQGEMGRRVGLSQLEVSDIERGKRRCLPAAGVRRLLSEANLAGRTDVVDFALAWFSDGHGDADSDQPVRRA